MKKNEIRESILKRADELARSGKYDGYMFIELQLRQEGYREARTILDSSDIRKELNQLCEESKGIR